MREQSHKKESEEPPMKNQRLFSYQAFSALQTFLGAWALY